MPAALLLHACVRELSSIAPPTVKTEIDPIQDGELLYRRVHKDRFRNQKTPYISPTAFEPRTSGREPDTDGISLFRADCLERPQHLLNSIADPDKRAANGIVAVSVAELHDLNLSVVSTPREDIVGHVSIPELSAAAMLNPETKEQCRIWMLELAKISSRDDRIILDPKAS